MQWAKVTTGLLAAGVAIALITSAGAFTIIAENQSNNTSKQDEKIEELLIDMKSMMARMNERMDMMVERMDAMMENVDMMMGMMMGDMMGPMGDRQGDTMEDMMNQEPQDVRIELKSGHGKVPLGKEPEIVLVILDKETEQPLEGLEVLIHIERGSSVSTMEMMGDMFPAEDKGSGEYIVRFTPDSEGLYTVHMMVMLPHKSMMDNHMDFSIIAE